jgi:hypothetical protein
MTHPRLLTWAFAAMGLVCAPLVASATDRLTNQEVKALLERIEHSRSEFEAALDDELKNSNIRTARGEVNANEFFDDFEDQVERTRERFESDYSSSSEVIALLEYATRIEKWISVQRAGFRGSNEWGVLAADLRRLASAYNTTLPMPANSIARRLNDAELVEAAAHVEKLIGPYRTAYASQLAADPSLTPAKRQSAIAQVDAMTTHARALNAALANRQKGVPEADALLKQGVFVIGMMSKHSWSQPLAAAWNPLRAALGRIAWAYEVNDRNLTS